MKKTILCLLLVLSVLFLSACKGNPPDPSPKNERATLDAVIEKIYDKSLYVRDTDGDERYFFVSYSDHITKNGESVSAGTLAVGDTVQIVYDGVLTDHSPAQIKNVYEIILTNRTTPEK